MRIPQGFAHFFMGIYRQAIFLKKRKDSTVA